MHYQDFNEDKEDDFRPNDIIDEEKENSDSDDILRKFENKTDRSRRPNPLGNDLTVNSREK